ncbi:MAG: hypothetical protein AAGJ84_14065 [Pseudomonadota bacterium]
MTGSSVSDAETAPIDAEFEPTNADSGRSNLLKSPGWMSFGILFVVLLFLLAYVFWTSGLASHRTSAPSVGATSNSEALAALAQTVSNLEAQLEQQTPALRAAQQSSAQLTNELQSAKQLIGSLETKIAALDRRVVETDSATGNVTVPQSLIDRISSLEADFDALSTRSTMVGSAQIDTITQELSELRRQIPQTDDATKANTLQQASLAMISISAEAARGRPFVLGHQQLTTALPNNTLVNGLAPYARKGVPTHNQLTAQFSILRQSTLEEATSAEGIEPNWVDQVFGDNVRVKRTASTPLVETLEAAEALLEDGDLEATIARLDTLPTGSAQQFDVWIADAQDRIDLDQRLDSLRLLLVSLAQ